METSENNSMITIGKNTLSLSAWCEKLRIDEEIVNIKKKENNLTDKNALCQAYVEQNNLDSKDLEIHELRRDMALLMANCTVAHYSSSSHSLYYTIDNSFPVGALASKIGIECDGLIDVESLSEFISEQGTIIEAIIIGLQNNNKELR